MTTAAAAVAEPSAPQSTPAPVVDLPDSGGYDGDDSLSASEEAYFESGGEKVDGLDGGEGGGEGEAAVAKEPVKAPAAKAKEAKTGEPAEGAEPSAAAADGTKKQTTVPHAALHEERENHKATKAASQAAIERAVRAEAKLQMIAEAFQQRKQPEAESAAAPPAPEPMPDPQKDIFGAFDWLVKQHATLQNKLGETEKATGEQIKQTRDQHEAHQRHVALKDAYDNDARAFWRQTPDFDAAYQHLTQGRDRELQLLGHADPAKRAEKIYSEEMQLAAHFISQNISPAAALYELAKQRGYTPKQAAAVAAAVEEPAAKPVAKKPTASEVVDAIAAGQSAARTLSGSGGSAGDTLTPDALLAMNEDQFAAACAKMTPAQEREMFGG